MRDFLGLCVRACMCVCLCAGFSPFLVISIKLCAFFYFSIFGPKCRARARVLKTTVIISAPIHGLACDFFSVPRVPFQRHAMQQLAVAAAAAAASPTRHTTTHASPSSGCAELRACIFFGSAYVRLGCMRMAITKRSSCMRGPHVAEIDGDGGSSATHHGNAPWDAIYACERARARAQRIMEYIGGLNLIASMYALFERNAREQWGQRARNGRAHNARFNQL